MAVHIDRMQKNLMRKQLEEIVQMHKDINATIDDYAKNTEPEAYKEFWNEMKVINESSIKKVTHFMVRKCNR